jgi:hypothetical protein
MVMSEEKLVRGKGNILLHVCEICGIPYTGVNEAVTCERSHDYIDLNREDNLVASSDTGTNDKSHSQEGAFSFHAKYRVVVKDASNLKVHNYILEAPNIKEAAKMVKNRYVRHIGYSIERVP